MANENQQPQIEYRGYNIQVKRDFGGRAHLVDGLPCMWGYVVVKGICNVMPGGTWFQTVKSAKQAIDILIDHGPDGFWETLRDMDAAVAEYSDMWLRAHRAPTEGAAA